MAELNKTPNAERVHIGFFGKRNAGKSSVVNALTGQEISIVSEVLGTTTDPVTKAMELFPLGPALIIDTPGIDDIGQVGEHRVRRAYRMLNKTDIAVLVVDSSVGVSSDDEKLISLFKEKNIPYIVVYNKSDIAASGAPDKDGLSVSAVTGEGIDLLRQRLGALSPAKEERRLIGDKLTPDDTILLVTPIDSSAPKGRLILPQVQMIRDILDSNGICITVQTDQVTAALKALTSPPKLVITDSQVFGKVKDLVPEEIPLTSFSILLAAYKGFLEGAVEGVVAISRLKDGDRLLVCEGCTHHRQCEDIGSVKIPNLIKKTTGSTPNFEFTSGGEFPENLEGYSMIIHCGGCMLSGREIKYREKCARDAGVPFTNYGTALAYMNGILKRSLSVFPNLAEKI